MDTIQTIDKLKEVFLPVAEKIGQRAEFGWEVVVKQQFIYGIIDLIFAFSGIIVIFVAYKISLNIDEFDRTTFLTIFITIGLAIIILGTIFGITHLLNPEYYAIEFFMKKN